MDKRKSKVNERREAIAGELARVRRRRSIPREIAFGILLAILAWLGLQNPNAWHYQELPDMGGNEQK